MLPWQRLLDPGSRLCLHWIACPRKTTPRIKQGVASCHTAEIISIQSLPAPPHTPSMCRSMVDIQSATAEIRRGKTKEEG